MSVALVPTRHRCLLLGLALVPATSWTPAAPLPAPPPRPSAAAPVVTMQLGRGPAGSRVNRREALLREMEAPLERREPDGEAADDPSAGLALAACRAGDARKAVDVTALRVAHLTSAAAFFVTMSGRSKAQIAAIVKNVEDEVLEAHGRRPNRQGKAQSGWVCLDYDAVVVNVFSERERDFYGLEKFWAAAQPLDLSGVLVPNTAEAAEAEAADDDDDWLLGDDDWELDDDDWSTEFADGDGGAKAGGAKADAAAEPKAWAWDDAQAAGGAAGAATDAIDDEDGGEPPPVVVDFGALDEAPTAAPWAEAELAEVEETEEEEEEEGEAGVMGAGDDGDDADWALGDDSLRTLVERAEGGGGDAATGGEGGWRSMMAEDGFTFDEEADAVELPADLADELAGADDDEAGVGSA